MIRGNLQVRCAPRAAAPRLTCTALRRPGRH